MFEPGGAVGSTVAGARRRPLSTSDRWEVESGTARVRGGDQGFVLAEVAPGTDVRDVVEVAGVAPLQDERVVVARHVGSPGDEASAEGPVPQHHPAVLAACVPATFHSGAVAQVDPARGTSDEAVAGRGVFQLGLSVPLV